MKNLKWLVTVMAACFGISFLDGVFSWGLPNGFYIVVGLVEIFCLVWLLTIAYAKNTTCVVGCEDCKDCKDC
jgi:hypothetical protein